MREPPRKLNVTDDTRDVFNVIVYLDGEKQDGCRWYDQDTRELNRLKMENGNPVVKDGEFVYETVKGEITVAWIDESSVNL